MAKKHYELRFVLSSATYNYRDEMSFCCYAEDEKQAFCIAENFFSYHKIGYVKYIGYRITNSHYREKYKIEGEKNA